MGFNKFAQSPIIWPLCHTTYTYTQIHTCKAMLVCHCCKSHIYMCAPANFISVRLRGRERERDSCCLYINSFSLSAIVWIFSPKLCSLISITKTISRYHLQTIPSILSLLFLAFLPSKSLKFWNVYLYHILYFNHLFISITWTNYWRGLNGIKINDVCCFYLIDKL